MKVAPLKFGLVLAGGWLTVLGGCGRTEPMLDGTYGYGDVSGDDGLSSGGTSSAQGGSANGSSVGGTSATGGAGGTHATGGAGGSVISSVGGSATGGTLGRGGVGGAGGEISSFGGSGDQPAIGGTFSRGGSNAIGGTGGDFVATGGAGGDFIATGGTGGDFTMTGGTGGDENTAGAPSEPQIICDDASCDPGTSVCCKRRGTPSTCESLATGCSSGATLRCSGRGSCSPDTVCCFSFNSSACQVMCPVSVGSFGVGPTVVLCDSSADCDPGQICVIAPRGIAYCASQAGG